jgi:hypothetical protein
MICLSHPAGGSNIAFRPCGRLDEGRFTMKFRDLFIPKWQHSNPEVRSQAVRRLRDISLLKQISEMDEHQMVRDAALSQLEVLSGRQVRVTESESE